MEPNKWHKASSTDISCVEVGVWRKSTRSGPWTDNCVEVAGAEDGDVLVRDTKDHGTGPILSFTHSAWAAFIADVKDGRFAVVE